MELLEPRTLAANPTEEGEMTDTGKKTKATVKPRKTATKTEKVAEAKGNVAEMAKPAPSREQIEQLARKFWAERGYQDGYAEQDWFRAEQELHHMAS
ncbi:MAG: DUF2934 domain-containing protein [Acidobacteriaceae bacterium]